MLSRCAMRKALLVCAQSGAHFSTRVRHNVAPHASTRDANAEAAGALPGEILPFRIVPPGWRS